MTKLSKKEGSPFKYMRYQDINQLGRYFSLSLNDKVTRLYTTVNFLVEENINFLKTYLKLSENMLSFKEEIEGS